jgi:hypothetical protein
VISQADFGSLVCSGRAGRDQFSHSCPGIRFLLPNGC